VFIDELHLLFRGGLEEALAELEAVAGLFAKRGRGGDTPSSHRERGLLRDG